MVGWLHMLRAAGVILARSSLARSNMSLVPWSRVEHPASCHGLNPSQGYCRRVLEKLYPFPYLRGSEPSHVAVMSMCWGRTLPNCRTRAVWNSLVSCRSTVTMSAPPSIDVTLVRPLALGNVADALEVLSAGYIINVYRDAEGNPLSSSAKALVTAAVFMGMLIGGLASGDIADKLGRRFALLISMGITFVCGASSAAAPSVGWLVVARVFAGVGVGGSVPAIFTMGAELFPTRLRGKIVVVIASFWMVGSVFAATAAWVLLGDDFADKRIVPGGTWRHYAAVAAIPAAITLISAAWFLPESPRFLLKAGRFEELVVVLHRILNKSLGPPSELLARVGPAAQDMSGIGGSSSPQTPSSDWSDNSPLIGNSVDDLADGFLDQEASHVLAESPAGIVSLLSGRESGDVTRSAVVLILVWFTISYALYGVSTWNNTLFADVGISNPYACSFIYAIGSLPGHVSSILLAEKVGRRAFLAWSMVLAAASASLFAFGASLGTAVIVAAACLFNAFSSCGWNVLELVSAEVFPTNVRASGMGLVATAGRIGSIAAQFANGLLEQNIPVLLVVTSGLMLLGGLASMLLPRDTRGVSLEGEHFHRGVKRRAA